MPLRRLQLAGFLALLTSCADVGSGVNAGIARTDSAGTSVVVVSAERLTEVPRLQLDVRPDLRIGIVDGDPRYQFYGARFPVGLVNGRIGVLNAGTHSVRIYDAEGRFLREFGRRGEGPGEFREPAGLVRIQGDSLLVWDRGLGRATVFDTSGVAGRMWAIRTARLNEVFLGAAETGDVYLQWTWRSGADNRRIVVRSTPAGVDTLLNLPLPVREIIAFGQPRWEVPEFIPSPAAAVSANSLWWSDGGPFEAARLNTAGQAEAHYHYAVPRREVTATFWSWYADSVAFKGPWPADEKPEVRRMMDRRGAADSMPSVDRLAVGRDGRVWMRKYQFFGEGAPWEWLVAEADGTPVSWLTLPRNMTPYEFGADYILAIARDGLDVQFIARYRLTQ